MATESSRTHGLAQLSPELALVDPALAAAARDALAVPDTFAVFAGPPRAAVLPPAIVRRSHQVRTRANTKVLVGVAAVLVLTLLLADVRVEVGRNRASAEPIAAPPEHETSVQQPPVVVKQPRAVVKQPRAAVKQPRSSQRPGQNRRSPSPGTTPPTAPVQQDPVSRRLAWAPVPQASAYHVEIFRGATRVFAATTAQPQLNVPAHWTVDGRTERLRPGEYRWYVWAIVAGQRQTQAVVQATLVVERP